MERRRVRRLVSTRLLVQVRTVEAFAAVPRVCVFKHIQKTPKAVRSKNSAKPIFSAELRVILLDRKCYGVHALIFSCSFFSYSVCDPLAGLSDLDLQWAHGHGEPGHCATTKTENEALVTPT